MSLDEKTWGILLFVLTVMTTDYVWHRVDTGNFHIPTDLVVAQEASDVESSSRFDFLVLHNL